MQNSRILISERNFSIFYNILINLIIINIFFMRKNSKDNED